MTSTPPQDPFDSLFASVRPPSAAVDAPNGPAWKVLLVDDAADIHAVMRLSLQDMVIEGRPLQLLDAFSAKEGAAMLAAHPDIALILLDVVMETSDAGLTLVRHIRQQLGNRLVRIVLLTGQPGYVPQRDVVINYEIDDYRLKSELTADTLFTCVYATLRTYKALQDLEQKRSLEQLAIDLKQANQRLTIEITERTHTQELADLRMRDLAALNKKLEDSHVQLLQSEKMASIGQLAAGVAHEINNPVGFVFSNLGMLDKYLEDIFRILDAYERAEPTLDAGTRERLQQLRQDLEITFLREDVGALLAETRDGINRVSKIVQDLKDFSRVGAEDDWHWVDLHAGLETTLNIVWNELKYKAVVNKQYGTLPLIYGLASQLNQVFMNLLVNAAHAIDTSGIVTLRTGQTGEEVWIEIEDTGSGIAPENLTRIFDPFFTTKPVGKGTGLGLSVSFSIVEKHHGRIIVNSELGKGTTFRVWLPIKQPETRSATTPPIAVSPAPTF
jgi:signal transduction histidine kinase